MLDHPPRWSHLPPRPVGFLLEKFDPEHKKYLRRIQLVIGGGRGNNELAIARAAEIDAGTGVKLGTWIIDSQKGDSGYRLIQINGLGQIFDGMVVEPKAEPQNVKGSVPRCGMQLLYGEA